MVPMPTRERIEGAAVEAPQGSARSPAQPRSLEPVLDHRATLFERPSEPLHTSSGVMPCPLSSKKTRIVSPVRRALTATRLPAPLNFRALP